VNERVAYLFAGELDRSELVEATGGEGGLPSLLTPTGLSLRRLTVVGALTEVEGKAGEYVHARVADPTGVFTLRSGRNNAAVSGTLTGIEPPAFVSLTAYPILPARNPASRVALLPEAVALVDRAARDTWVIATADATLARLEAMNKALSGEEHEQALDRAREFYRITPPILSELADMVATALASVAPGPGEERRQEGEPGGPDPKELVLAFLAARPKDAVSLETVLAELGRRGIGAEAGTRAVNELLAEGECYAPKKGSVRLA